MYIFQYICFNNLISYSFSCLTFFILRYICISNFLKAITGTNGLYEARIKLGSNIWRVFCFFDKGKLVILLNGFQKKTQKTPRKEINKALKLMESYYNDKNK